MKADPEGDFVVPQREQPSIEAQAPDRRELVVIVLLCVAAAIRVFVFAAGFPLFDNIDEQAHCDLVYRYSHGSIPRGIAPFRDDTARDIVLFGTPEYFNAPESLKGGMMTLPTWSIEPEYRDIVLARWLPKWKGRMNYESMQPPVYYGIAGAWVAFGRSAGMNGGRLPYWIRFLNVEIFGLLVWLSYVFVRRCFPTERFLRIGVPAVVAFVPQDVYFSINNDVPSAVLTLGVLWVAVEFLRPGSKSLSLAIGGGLTASAAVLTKMTNAPAVAVAGVAATIWALRARRLAAPRREFVRILAFAAAVVIPITLWIAHNVATTGDPTGTAEKIRLLGWTAKPLLQRFDHPIFTLSGVTYFWSELLRTFWRGEFLWHGRTIASPACDAVYVFSTTALLGIAALATAGWLPAGRAPRADDAGRALLACWLVVLTSVGLLAWLSMAFDFGDCVNPSRERPFFTSGRLISGALVPVVVLYLIGLNAMLEKLRIGFLRSGFVAALVAMMLVSEVSLTRPAFASAFNWFHLP